MEGEIGGVLGHGFKPDYCSCSEYIRVNSIHLLNNTLEGFLVALGLCLVNTLLNRTPQSYSVHMYTCLWTENLEHANVLLQLQQHREFAVNNVCLHLLTNRGTRKRRPLCLRFHCSHKPSPPASVPEHTCFYSFKGRQTLPLI